MRYARPSRRAREERVSTDAGTALAGALARLEAAAEPNLKPVFNLTGTVLHTNLGRALIAEEAVEAAVTAMRNAVALEFDLGGGKRGERDDHLRAPALRTDRRRGRDRRQQQRGGRADRAQHAAPKGREAIVSRGELIEIGGAFRMPDIMARAGAKLVEVGTTNRTHPKDYVGAINAEHRPCPEGAHVELPYRGLHQGSPRRASLRRSRTHASVPMVNDLGSGTLIDLARFGLAHEPTVAEAIAEGADLVTFSGDKLLGGPADRLHRRPPRPDRAHQQEPDEARAAHRQSTASRCWRRR